MLMIRAGTAAGVVDVADGRTVENEPPQRASLTAEGGMSSMSREALA
jgi:hypothetical protein